jgi:hypothetical protein
MAVESVKDPDLVEGGRGRWVPTHVAASNNGRIMKGKLDGERRLPLQGVS